MSNILILLFWIFLIFLFLNKIFFKLNYTKDENFNDTNNAKIKVYNFNTTWCGYSIRFQPIWDSFTKSLEKSDNIVAYDVKCDDNKNNKLIERYYIEGYPTIIIDYGNKFIKYSGPRTVNGLRSVLKLKIIKEPEQIIKEPEPIKLCNNIKCNNVVSTPPKVMDFNNETENKETILYNFNTSWCGYSVRFQSIWDRFTETNTNDNIKIIDVKCDNSENENFCNEFQINGYPTVVKVKNNIVTQYDGVRTLEGLQNFAKN